MSSSYQYTGPVSDQLQQQADALGITPSQYLQIAAWGGNNNQVTLGGQGNQAWNTAPGAQGDATYQNVARQLQIFKALQGAVGGGGKTAPGPTQPTTVAQNPLYDITNLGAAALGEQAVYNPQPGPADPKSGIGTVTQPQVTTNKAVAPQGPWSYMAGALGKQGPLPQAPANTPALDTIGSKMTPAQFSDVADQIRGGANYVTVDGKPYTITQQNIQHITQAYPGQQTTNQAPQTTPLTATTPATAATSATGGANTGALDFGSQVATNAINQEIQRQLSQGNAWASAGTGPPPGWRPTSTGQPQQTVTPPTPQPVQTNLPPPAPVQTSQPQSNPMGGLMGALGGIMAAKGGGAMAGQGSMGANAASAAANTALGTGAGAGAGAGSNLTWMQKQQLANIIQQPAQNAQQWAQGVANAGKGAMTNAIPSPEDFRQSGGGVTFQRPTVV